MNGDRDLFAAEYVLGTLDAAERNAASRLRLDDPAFDRTVTDWERRLAPLATGAASVDPSSTVWPRILATLDGNAGSIDSTNVVLLRRSLQRWRIATLATGALAAGLALFTIDRTLLRTPPQTQEAQGPQPGAYIAAVNRGGDMPALIVRVDLASRSVTVRPVEADAPQNKSLELWYVAAGKPPKSMGVVRKDGERMPMVSNMDVNGASFAVSVEPMGGSPTGSPTGPIVYKGALIAE